MNRLYVAVVLLVVLIASLLPVLPLAAESSPSSSNGGGGIDPATGQMWVDATSSNGGALKGKALSDLIAFFRKKGFEPTNYSPTWDPTRGRWILIFQAAVNGAKVIKPKVGPAVVVPCYWDAKHQCMRRRDNGKACNKQAPCLVDQ